MSTIAEARERYEAQVRALAIVAKTLLDAGQDEELVAREMVRQRNELKREFRANDPPEIVAIMEARNLRKYGDPIGMGPDGFFIKYGSWHAVIEAACRPADLRRMM